MSEQLPFIWKSKRKIVAGQVVEEINLKVQGKELSECEKVFDRKWKIKK